MHKTVEAIIDPDRQIQLLEPLNLSQPMRALLRVREATNETALLSEAALAGDWEH